MSKPTFAKLITKPHSIRAVFVADLHLSADTPELNLAFVALLCQLQNLPNLDDLYILGDWLDGWIGDDDYLSLNQTAKNTHWLTPILSALQNLSNTQVHIMHGNRDFTISWALCDEFGGKLIKEPHFIHLDGRLYRLEHGDKLCTDDKQYQRYRRIIRNPVVGWLLLKLPLAKRRQLAQNIKHQSAQHKHTKHSHIMDTNAQAVAQALASCDTLVHGHTHRPACHHFSNNTLGNQHPNDKQRLVLGDWRYHNQQVKAMIGVYTDTLVLCEFCHDIDTFNK